MGMAESAEWIPEQVAADSVVPVSADMRPVGHQLGWGDSVGETSRIAREPTSIQWFVPENVYAGVDDADVFEEIDIGTDSDGSSDGSTRVLIDPSSTDASSGSETDTGSRHGISGPSLRRNGAIDGWGQSVPVAAASGISLMRNTANRPSREWFSFMPSFSSGRHRGGGFWV